LGLYVWHAIADDTPAYITPVSVAELGEQGFDGVILDVRTPEEFAQAHIPHALNVPHPLLTNHLATLGKTDTPLLVYCRSGRRARIAMDQLHDLGYRKLYHLTGDMQAWQAYSKP
jgi:rhodanese-related sulfurtransferase|tara:strand:+ start:3612 stop:3956 length:345 start_codon:yes stop_codon:yes gene_type:complete